MVKILGYFNKKFRIHVLIIVVIFLFGSFHLSCFINFKNNSQLLNNGNSIENLNLVDLVIGEDNSLNTSSNFEMIEYANITSSQNNTSNIDIEMPSAGWNVTNIQLNFTDIRLKEETVVIASENESSDFWILDYDGNERLAMQIEVTEDIKLFSVQILGFSLGRDLLEDEVSVKITDWDGSNNNPINVDSPYGEIGLNISNIAGWHSQIFPDPIDLGPGDYAIVLDGHGTIKEGLDIYWFMNQSNPNPLYMSYYYKFFGWRWGRSQYDVFCHKLTWRMNRVYNPSEINMTATIDGIHYKVFDGYSEGYGYIKLSNTNITIPEVIFNIEIKNNQSIQLIFNFTYILHLTEIVLINSIVTIKEGEHNKWKIIPFIDRCSCNYSVSFKIPKSWHNLTIYKNNVNITVDPNIIFDGNNLQIKNDTITDNSSWLITAQNEKKAFSLNSQETIYNPADEIEIEIESSFLNGEFIFILLDSNSQEKYTETKSLSGSTDTFSYVVRSDDIGGIWNALVFWNNQTHAGIEIISFTVDIPFVLSPFSIFLISIISIGAVSSVYGSYKIIKRRKNLQEMRKRRIIDKCMDIVNLNHILVTDKDSSLTLFDKKYTDKVLDANLISGFLQAIRSFGIELTNTKESSQIIKLEYKDLKVIMDEYYDFRMIFLMKDMPSNEFLNSIKDLSYELKEKFGKYLEDFNGDIRPFKYVDRLIIKHLNGELLNPLKISEVNESKLSQAEKNLISKIRKLQKINEADYVLFRELVQERSCDPEEILLINKLIEKGILKPDLILN
ncbi:MAG: hypothetical protein EU542_07880 [Promethearchaeota archaeon]|nr:MAG: hypothetical protein EU542_07880 [Candidatus Lokiarchaeota archaeon]